ncbi:MAG TPA: LUD domain-containing protein [Bacteroidia bacterium]|nr:LUD domain-containing protein [Bacteroidia bacterium]HMU18342.1 LUD domain-containing protein [Bacteroidia bacterium]
MDESTNREKVLKKVRSALIAKTPNPYPNLDMDKVVFNSTSYSPEVQFAESFIQQGGQFVLCNGRVELMETILGVCDANDFSEVVCVDRNLSAFFDEFEFPHQSVFSEEDDTDIQVVIIPCECLVVRNGLIVLSDENIHHKALLRATQNLVVIAHTQQLIPDLTEALTYVRSQNDTNMPSELHVATPDFLNQAQNTLEPNAPLKSMTVILIRPYDSEL